MASGDVLAEVILLLAANIPTAVIRQGTQGWEEPQWTSETSRQLMGIVSAIQGPPNSFTSSSSPIDLTRLAVWITACNSALSRPGGDRTAQGSVVPTEVGGAKSASKYLQRVFGSLRAISSEQKHQAAIATLERLLKLWMKDKADEALALVRKNKISWGSVLIRGSPTETKKVKGNLITQVKSPSKPSRSPFLSNKERQLISSLLAPIWDRPAQMRTDWNKLSSEEQHDQYHEFVKMLKEHNEKLNKISTSIHAKLGHRKRWIHAACEERNAAPSKKKEKTNEFVWSQNFFKLTTTEVNLSVALIFAPSHYLVDPEYDCDTILTRLWRIGKVVDAPECTAERCGKTEELWKEWAQRFRPDFSQKKDSMPQAETLADKNPFADLPDDDDS